MRFLKEVKQLREQNNQLKQNNEHNLSQFLNQLQSLNSSVDNLLQEIGTLQDELRVKDKLIEEKNKIIAGYHDVTAKNSVIESEYTLVRKELDKKNELFANIYEMAVSFEESQERLKGVPNQYIQQMGKVISWIKHTMLEKIVVVTQNEMHIAYKNGCIAGLNLLMNALEQSIVITPEEISLLTRQPLDKTQTSTKKSSGTGI